jgi:hypothetical protein
MAYSNGVNKKLSKIFLTSMRKRLKNRDRRSGEDRRRSYSLDYLSNGGVERRSWKERRSQVERRVDWMRVSKWVSVLMSLLKIRKAVK